MPSLRDSILTRYSMFLKSLSKANSMEIRLLASISFTDGRCTTGHNFSKMTKETGLDMMNSSKQNVKQALLKSAVPAEDEWRAPLLARLLQERWDCLDLEADDDIKHLDNLIDMVCSSTFS